MGTVVVLDTSVVLALFDPNDGLHRQASDVVRRSRGHGDRFVLPASALAEILVGAARRGPDELRRRHAQTVAAFGTAYPADEAVAVAAASRRAAHSSLRLPDALVIATADVLEADRLLTGDKRWRAHDERVVLIAAS